MNALSLDLLPSPDDKRAVFAFAMTFNGFEHFGSFDAAAAHARMRSRASVVDLRNELFIAARAARHCGDDRYLATYVELLPHFHRLIHRLNTGAAE